MVVLGLTIGLPLLLGASVEDTMRYAGLSLQLFGVSVVAYTLRSRGKLFDRVSVIAFAYEWIRRAPSFSTRNITLEASGTAIVSASGTADAIVWRGPRLDQPIEDQLEAIRENLATLRGQVDAQEFRTSARLADLSNAIDAERNQRSVQVQESKRKLEEFAADSLYLEVAGLAWLVSGIVLATIPSEAATLIQWLTR